MADVKAPHARYGTLNLPYMSTWADKPKDEPMWALNLMSYRERAEYADGRETTLTGWEADNLYSPLGPIAAVGAELVIVAIVVDQPAGTDHKWDRVAIVRYPYRNALVEMNMMPEFQEAHLHKDAGMKFTIVSATFPRPDTVDRSLADAETTPESLMLLQFVEDADAPEVDVPGARRIATFDVEGVAIGDERTWAQARWDLLPADASAETIREATAAAATDGDRYVVVLKPQLGDFLRAVANS
ncbi:MAG TPA: hypothetical protein VHB69_03410 [Mycobacteriales bacterium]|nr:hypothetical protein [Mycobacteriales bacterium]